MRDHPSPGAGAGGAEPLPAAEVAVLGRPGSPDPARPVAVGRTLKEAEARTRELEADLADQERVLERIARGEPLAVTLETLCRRFESRYPDARCSVLHLDPEAGILRHAAAPSLPESFRAAIDGLAVGEGVGACGTAAARNEIVVVADTSVDPLTESFRAARRDARAAVGVVEPPRRPRGDGHRDLRRVPLGGAPPRRRRDPQRAGRREPRGDRHRAPAGGGRGDRRRPARPAHRPHQPGAVPRAARSSDARSVQRGRGALLRPGPLQVDQRQPRPPVGRPDPGGGGRPTAGGRPFGRSTGPVRGRRVQPPRG